MVESALSELVVWHGTPSGIFPRGRHTYPADLEVLGALIAALRNDLAETHLVPVADLLAEETIPFRLTSLRAFLATHRRRLDATLRHERVVANTLAHGARRIAHLRALEAPAIVVDNEVAELAAVASESWTPAVDPFASVPDVLDAASVIDVEARPRLEPLAIDVDLSDLVLLAARCCISPDVTSVEGPWIEGLEWQEFPRQGDEAPVPGDVVRVRPVLSTEIIADLAFADVRAVSEAAVLPPGAALLRVHIAPTDESSDAELPLSAS